MTYFPVNGSLLPGNTQPAQNYQPEGVVLLPSNVLFVSFGFSSGWEFLNASTGRLLADWWPGYVFDSSTEAAYDPSNGLVYMTNGAQSQIQVVNTTTRSNAGVITASYEVGTIAYDPVNGYLYAGTVGGCGGGKLQVIDPTNSTILANITLVSNVMGIAYDPPARGMAIVDSTGYSYCGTTTGNVEVFNGTSSVPAFNVSTANASSAVTFDPANNSVLVAGNGQVWVYNSTTGAFRTNRTLPGFPPGGLIPSILYVNQTGNLYVSDLETQRFFVLNATNFSITASLSEWPPAGGGIGWTYPIFDQLAYVPSTRTVEMATGLFDQLYRLNVSSNRFTSPFMVEFDPTTLVLDAAGQNLLVAGYDQDPGSGLNPWLGTGGDELLNATSLATVSPFNLTELQAPWGCGTYDGTLASLVACTNLIVGDPNGTVLFGQASLGGDPTGIAWDSRDSQLWYSDNSGPRAYYLNDSNTSNGHSVRLGFGTNGVAYDAAANELLFLAGGNVLGYNATTQSLLFNASVGGTLASAAYDSATNTLFFINSSSAGRYLVDFNVSSHAARFGVSIPCASQASVVPATSVGFVYVLDGVCNIVLAVNLSSRTLVSQIAVGTDPVSGVYVPATNRLLVANQGSESISVIGPEGGNYSVRFNESGLPGGTSWSVNIGGTLVHSSGGSVSTLLPNGTYDFVVTALTGYRISPVSGSVAMNGSAVSRLIVFTALFALQARESGLPAGTTWSVTVNGTVQSSASPTIAFNETNGTYPFDIGALPGWTAHPWSGTATVAGAALELPINWTAVEYNVTFVESGLPAGTVWGVTVGSTPLQGPSASLTVSVANGSYSYLVAPLAGWHTDRYSGSLTIAASPSVVFLNWTEERYTAVFEPQGLPAGTPWGVELNGTWENTTASALDFSFPNGTVPFRWAGVPGWRTREYSGNATIDGSGVEQVSQWTPVTYRVGFLESGLPAGTRWSVTVGGVSNASTGSELTFSEPNATGLPFRIGAPSYYSATPASGSIDVSPSIGPLAIAFALSTPAPVIVSVNVTPARPSMGANLTAVVEASGGALPLSYRYQGLPAGCLSENSSELRCAPTENGTFPVTISAVDRVGRIANYSWTLVVLSVPTSPTAPSAPAGVPAPVEYLLIVVVVAVVVVAALWIVRRRRGRGDGALNADGTATDENP